MFAYVNRFFVKRPMLTNMVSTGFLFGSGDVLAQSLFPAEIKDKLTDNDKTFDFLRTLRVITYGGVIFAPIGVKWYGVLGRIRIFKSSAADAFVRVAADQLLFAPFIAIPMYYSCMSVLELSSDPIGESKRKLQEFWWTTLRNNWSVWPAFQFFNFAIVPPQYKLLAVNLFSIGWNCYLSWLLNGPRGELTEEAEQIMI